MVVMVGYGIGDSLLCLPLLLLALHSHIVASVKLQVSYPQAENYSYVRLTCTDDFNDPLDGVFLVDGTVIESDTTLITLTQQESDSIEFTFTQSQEGFFWCRALDDGVESPSTGLAGELTSFTQYVCQPLLVSLWQRGWLVYESCITL